MSSEVTQQHHETEAERLAGRNAALAKVQRVLATGLRIVRDEQEKGAAKQRAVYAANREKLFQMLVPRVTTAEENIEKAEKLKTPFVAAVPSLLAMRGTVGLPVRDRDHAWWVLEQTNHLMNDGIAGFERLVETAKGLLAVTNVNADTLTRADYIAKQLAPAADLAFGLSEHLKDVVRIFDEINGKEGPDFSTVGMLTIHRKPEDPKPVVERPVQFTSAPEGQRPERAETEVD